MGKLKKTETKLKGVKIIEPAVFGDHRGFFTESYCEADFKAVGIDILCRMIIPYQPKQMFYGKRGIKHCIEKTSRIK